MNFMTEHKVSLISKEDFDRTANGLVYSESETLNNGEWNYQDKSRIVTIKKASGSPGSFIYPIRGLFIGDIIDVSFEYRNISGDYLRCSVDEDIGATYSHPAEYSNEWQTITLKHVIRQNIPKNSTSSRILIGYITSDLGIAEIKNVHIKISTIKSTSPPPNFKKFHLVKRNGAWMIDSSFASDKATINLQADNKRLKLVYNEPFVGDRPIAIASGGGYYGNSHEFRPVTLGSHTNEVVIELIKSDSTNVRFTEVDDAAYFTLLVVGNII